MSEISRVLAANRAFSEDHIYVDDPHPTRRLAVLTCMDARIDVFAAMGLNLGEAHVLRNAGGRVTDDVLRSLALSSHVLGVNALIVMQHTQCGLEGVTDEQLRAKTGTSLTFHAIANHETALQEDVELLTKQPYLEALTTIAGFVYDIESGTINDVIHWERSDR